MMHSTDSARLDAWRVIGPGGGGTMMKPTVSPHDPLVAVCHCDMTGSYITLDGGHSWRMMNIATGMAGFAFDPTDADVIYGYNVALWRSEDRGATWRLVWPDPESHVVEHRRGDHANYSVSCDDASYPSMDCRITAVAVDPADGAKLTMTARGRRRGQTLYASTDRGASWTVAGDLGDQIVQGIVVCDGVVRVPVTSGVYELAGGALEHLPASEGGTISAATTGGLVVYAITTRGQAERHAHRRAGGALRVSADGGRTWADRTASLLAGVGEEAAPPVFRTVACCGGAPDTAYLSYQFPLPDEQRGPAVRCGIVKTTDCGESWQIVWEEAGKPAPNMQTSQIELQMPDGFPNIYTTNPLGLGIAPSDANVCFATDIFRNYKTDDGGASWWSCHSENVGENRWRTTGLDVTTNYGVHFDPFDLDHMFITYTDIGLCGSRDGGRSWTSALTGIPQRWENTTYWLAFDPQVRDLLWGAFALNHDLPRPKMWRQFDPADYEGGVAVSTDGGETWTVTTEGMPQTACTHILLDPKSPLGSRTLYACGFGRGVFKSVDNGKSWAPKNAGIEGEQPFAWRLTLADDGTLYLVLARRSERGEIGDESDGALYRSTDGAETWEKMTLPAGCNGPSALTLDPTDKRRMYLSAWGLARMSLGEDGSMFLGASGEPVTQDVGGGVFLSEDGGATWRNIFDRDQHIYDLTVDAKNPKTLYICGFDSAAHRSLDGGRTWEQLGGFNFKWGHRVIPDPRDAEKVYITTYGGSVWHGPAGGDPNATGDVVTPMKRAEEV